MKIVIVTYIILFFSIEAKAQYHLDFSPDSVASRANTVKSVMDGNHGHSVDVAFIDSLIQDLKDYSDHLYYVTKWNLSLSELDKEKRILLIKKVSLYPFYLVQNQNIAMEASRLYELSIHELIREYSGNADLLKTIQVVPAYQGYIYPKLKQEIEAAGGIWERGPIPQVFFSGIKVKKD